MPTNPNASGGLNESNLIVDMLRSAQESGAAIGDRLARNITNVRDGELGTVKYDFLGNTRTMPEPRDVLLSDDYPSKRYIAAKRLEDLCALLPRGGRKHPKEV